jgi:hypothetical protein
MIEFNVNDYVLVKVTKRGKEIHRKKYDELVRRYNPPFPYRPIEEDSEGWSKWQLWELMNQLGSHCENGFDPPFETTIQILNRDHSGT